MLQFKNPQTGRVETISSPVFWSSLLGPVYFASNGVWPHAVASTLLGLVTLGLSWVIYPFFARSIVRASFLRRGWVEIGDEGWTPPTGDEWMARVAQDDAEQEDRRKQEARQESSTKNAGHAVARRARPTSLSRPAFGKRAAG